MWHLGQWKAGQRLLEGDGNHRPFEHERKHLLPGEREPVPGLLPHRSLLFVTPARTLTIPGPYLCLISGHGVVPENCSEPPATALASSCLLHDFGPRFCWGRLPGRQVPGPSPKAGWWPAWLPLQGLPSPVLVQQGCPGLPFCTGRPHVPGRTPFPQGLLSAWLWAPSWGAWCVPQLARWETPRELPATRLPPGLRPGVSSGPYPKARREATTWGLRGLRTGRNGGWAALRAAPSAKPFASHPARSPQPRPERGTRPWKERGRGTAGSQGGAGVEVLQQPGAVAGTQRTCPQVYRK